MKKLYYKFFVLIFIASGIAGCKLDPPIYPASGNTTGTTSGTGTATGSGTGTGTGTGTDQNDGNGLPIDGASNIKIQINGTTYKFTQNALFMVYGPGSTMAQQAGATNGFTAIQASKGTSVPDQASILYESATTGTFDIEEITIAGFTLDGSGTGKIKVTKLTNSNIQGTFSVDIVDINTNAEYKHCLGSFNINK